MMVVLNRAVEGAKSSLLTYCIVSGALIVILTLLGVGWLDGMKVFSLICRGVIMATLILPALGLVKGVSRPVRIAYTLILAGLVCSGPNVFKEPNPISLIGAVLTLGGMAVCAIFYLLAIRDGRVGLTRHT